MSIPKGTLVDTHRILLSPAQRAKSIPADTAELGLEIKIKGILQEDADLGQTVRILTPAGRVLSGSLTEADPEYRHRFGHPIPELQSIGSELRKIIRDYHRLETAHE
jgi:hypothetical protein